METIWEIMGSTKWSSNILTTIYNVPPPLHKVVTKKNMVTNSMLIIINVLLKNNNVWYIIIANHSKLLNALVFKVKPYLFFNVINAILEKCDHNQMSQG
jgi:hypothetical protein